MISAHDRIAAIQKEVAEADEGGDTSQMTMARQDAIIDLLSAILLELGAIRLKG